MPSLRTTLLYLIAFWFATFAVIGQAFAAGGLVLTPPGLEIPETGRAGAVTLYNKSDKTLSYLVTVAPLLDGERGSYNEVCKSLIFAPSRITLRPNSGHQTLRLMFLEPYSGGPERCRIKLQNVTAELPAEPGAVEEVSVGVAFVISVTFPVSRGIIP